VLNYLNAEKFTDILYIYAFFKSAIIYANIYICIFHSDSKMCRKIVKLSVQSEFK